MKEGNIMENENTEKRCQGCGVVLQDQNVLQEGYTTNLENDICQRCFRMKNYGEYQVVAKSNDEYIDILKEVGKTKDLVLYITDLLNLEKNIEQIRTIIPNKMILVLNKMDVLPKSVKEEKLKAYLEGMNIHFEEIIVISTAKNYNIDYLLKRIKYFHNTRVKAYILADCRWTYASLCAKTQVFAFFVKKSCDISQAKVSDFFHGRLQKCSQCVLHPIPLPSICRATYIISAFTLRRPRLLDLLWQNSIYLS